ncbi:MAG: ImcF-related family protein [Longimicrobiales bacterium]
MKGSTKAWLSAALAFLPFPAIAWVITVVRSLPGALPWVVWGSLTVLGLVTAAMVYWYVRQRGAGKPTIVGLAKRVDEVFTDTRRRLSGAKRKGLRNTPAVVFLGPQGAAKTTAVVKSDLSPELLVGEVNRGDAIVPTPVANVWYCADSVFVEVGLDVLEDKKSWRRLIARVRPRRWAPTLGRGKLPSRAAVVCVPVHEFLNPDSHEYAVEWAAELRERLGELSKGLGIELPVYVLFTKLDRIPYFSDFARVLDEGEVREGLGATLPFEIGLEAAAYGEQQTSRVDEAFDRLYRSLSRQRMSLLPRDGDPLARLGAYEFPRELNKIRDVVTQFLVDLCRPTQLSAGPRLRGFYFTGVRAIEVGGAPHVQAPVVSPPDDALLEATRIFSAAEVAAQPHAQAAEAPRTQEVAEWVFLNPVLRHVIRGDVAAETLTGGGALVNVARRALLAAAMVGLVAFGIGATVSFSRNLLTHERATEAVAAVRAIPETVVGAPDLEQLASLDSLRSVVSLLTEYEVNGHPLSHGWGLFRGSDVRNATRPLYFDRFQRLILADARRGLIDQLAALSLDEGGSANRDGAYAALKAYLITAGYADQSTSEFLTPVLLDRWLAGRGLGAETTGLVQGQMDFYADELAFADPYSFLPNEPLVERARAFIQSFADDDRYYTVLLDEASRQADPVDLATLYPEGAPVLQNAVRLPGAFTKEGWTLIHDQLANLDEVLGLEEWVAGTVAIPPAERAALASELQARYETEYVERWAGFLDGATLAGSGSVARMAQNLQILSGRESPLLQMFALISQNTDVDSTVAAAFQPVQLVTPPDATDRIIGEGNQGYVDGLAAIRTALGPLAEGGGTLDDATIGAVASSADQAEDAVRQVAQGFVIEGRAGPVGDAVQRLMETPIGSARGLARGLPSRQANAAGASFCSDFNRLTAMYPFTTSGAEASLDEVIGMFKPGESALWGYYDRTLSGLLERRGSRFEAIPDANPRPSAPFVRFFNDAASLSSALFTPDGAGPQLDFGLRILTTDRLTEVEVNVDGQVHRFTRTAPGIQAFRWSADRARNATILGQLDGETVRLVEPQPGQWALFRLFQIAEWEPRGGGRYTVRWPLTVRDYTVEGEVTLNASVPVLSQRFLSGLRCTARIAG